MNKIILALLETQDWTSQNLARILLDKTPLEINKLLLEAGSEARYFSTGYTMRFMGPGIYIHDPTRTFITYIPK